MGRFGVVEVELQRPLALVFCLDSFGPLDYPFVLFRFGIAVDANENALQLPITFDLAKHVIVVWRKRVPINEKISFDLRQASERFVEITAMVDFF
jgi:hypothetical protein